MNKLTEDHADVKSRNVVDKLEQHEKGSAEMRSSFGLLEKHQDYVKRCNISAEIWRKKHP